MQRRISEETAASGVKAEPPKQAPSKTDRCPHAYIDKAFGEGREGLVFTAELTARNVTSRFINRFGSPAYFAHNDSVMVDQHRKNLIERIDESGFGGAADDNQ